MIRITEATYTRRVLRSALPVLVCFGAQACPARKALLPALERIAAHYAGRLQVAEVIVERAPLLAEQYAIQVSPTILVIQHGERRSQVIGFMPSGLLDLLAEATVQELLGEDTLWSPLEAQLEEAVLIPMFQAWGWTVQRQVPCLIGERQQRGRIDLLVGEKPAGAPITLVESKRSIRSSFDLQQAVRQAGAYARSLGLATFCIAAPQGIWVYRDNGAHTPAVQAFSSLELHHSADALRNLLRQLHVRPR